LGSETINQNNPIFLDIVHKKESIILDDGSLLSILTVQPYIKVNKNTRKLFYYQSDRNCILPMPDTPSQQAPSPFQIAVLIYGLAKDNIVSMHLFNMPKASQGVWEGSLSQLKYTVKTNIRHVRQSGDQWLNDPPLSDHQAPPVCTLALQYSHTNTGQTNYMTIRHENGIIGVHDIFEFNKHQAGKSLKDQFSISTQSNDTCLLTPKNPDLVGMRFVVDLWLKSKSQRSQYYLRLKPGNTLDIDQKEFVAHQNITLFLKLFNQDNFPVKLSRKHIHLSDFKLDQQPISIDTKAYIASEAIQLTETSLKFRKGQKLSFKIRAGSYFPKQCLHVVSEQSNIVVHLTEAPIPKSLDNLPENKTAVIVMDERGRKPLGTIKLFDNNRHLLATLKQSNICQFVSNKTITQIIFDGNEFYGRADATLVPQSGRNIVHLFLPAVKKTLWFQFKDKKSQKKISDINFTLIKHGKTYRSTKNSLTLPIYVYDAFRVDVSSENYITAYGQKTLFQCTQNFQQCPGFSQNKPIAFEIDKKIMIQPKITLFCKIGGQNKDVYADEIDEEVIIKAGRVSQDQTEKNMQAMTYDKKQNAFVTSLPCPESNPFFFVDILSEKFEPIQKELKWINQPIKIELKLNKPVLYMTINPSQEILRGPLHRSKMFNFEKIKNRYYETMAYLDSTKPWEDAWSSNHFFVRYASQSELLIKPGIVKPKWGAAETQDKVIKKIKPEVDELAVDYHVIVNEGIQLINDYSISDNLGLKGVMVFITGVNTLKSETLEELQHNLEKNQVGAVIARFGIFHDGDYNYTSDKNKYKNLTVVEYNINKEFNDDYFGSAFKKVRKELWGMMARNGFGLGRLGE
jgi:hypothetical protein